MKYAHGRTVPVASYILGTVCIAQVPLFVEALMKRTTLLPALAVLCGTVLPLSAKDLKVLMIGNSFSICVQRNLPKIVHAAPGQSLRLASAYIGGCPMEKHWEHIEALEADPQAEGHRDAYLVTIYDSKRPGRPAVKRHGNVNELLVAEKWDIVTIQEASPRSWQENGYHQFGDRLVEYIRRKAPQARIILQQTWAYRADDPRICPLRSYEWQFGQEEMYARVDRAVRAFAQRHALPVIPTGYAVQLARQHDGRRFRPQSEGELAKLRWPDLPPQASDPVGKYFWEKDKKGELNLKGDFIHLNIRGEYLQACVWFQFLYGVPATEIAYEHPDIDRADCQFLQRMARQVVDTYPVGNKQDK